MNRDHSKERRKNQREVPHALERTSPNRRASHRFRNKRENGKSKMGDGIHGVLATRNPIPGEASPVRMACLSEARPYNTTGLVVLP